MVTAGPGVPQLLRAINDRSALELLVEHGPLSRTALGRLTGLSHPTATRLLARLEETGLVVEAGLQGGRKGPHSLLYSLNPRAAHVAAVDVTPDRIEVAIADLTGAVVGGHRLPRSAAPRRGDAPARVRRAVEGAVGPLGLALRDLSHVAIGTPGSIDPRTGGLAYAEHLPGWQDRQVVPEIQEALGVPIQLENDVNLAAIAEHRQGAGAGFADFALFWMGEGLGVGVVMDGALRRGATGGAGEISYLPVPGVSPSRGLRQGHPGDFQLRASAAAVLVLAQEHGLPGRTAEAALRAARRSGTAALPFLRELAGRVAEGLAAVVCLLNPEVIVVSGPVGRAGGPELVRLVEEELTAITIATPKIVVSSLEGNPVQAGATIKALDATRERLFSSTTTRTP